MLQCCPALAHVPFEPVHLPPAPSDAPHAAFVQFGTLHVPVDGSRTNPPAQLTALQLPAPSQLATIALGTVVHTVPSDAGVGDEHVPVAAVHVPALWHWSGFGHGGVGPGEHPPLPSQVSGFVHALLSALHELPAPLFE